MPYSTPQSRMKPSVTFEAYGFRETSSPGLTASFPRGQAFIFPHYFAFLTTRHFRGGMQFFEEAWQMSWHSFVKYTQTVLKIHKWTAHPASIALDIAKALGDSKYQEPKIILKALANQGSFFFPLSDLTDVVAGGGSRSGIRQRDPRDASRAPYFRLVTRDQTYLVQMPVPLAHSPVAIVRTMRQVATSNWQPRALELLQAAAARNAAGH
jgi:hypothetical protein